MTGTSTTIGETAVIVAKVGGSLYDEPRLGPALRLWLSEQPEPVLLVPGGGEFADAVRKLDRVHGLGEEAAHGLAMRTLSATAEFLEQLLTFSGSPPHPQPLSPGGEGSQITVLDPYPFFREHDLTPHTWAVSSDSLAAAVATHFAASELVLLKSTDIPPGTPWSETAAQGWVDAHFPELAPTVGCPIRPLNFRRWIEDRFGNRSG